jgi:glutathione synthase/RimK-type ligase-like ATP-grasp enzyme
MSIILVVNNPEKIKININGINVVSAKDYLLNYFSKDNAKIFNICKSYKYQSLGYYVSLLAAARGHKCFPNITTIQEMKSVSLIRIISQEIDDLIQKHLLSIHSTKFTLSIYFGKNPAKKYDKLCKQIFNLFQAPLLRAFFIKKEKWKLSNIQLISFNEIPDEHLNCVEDFAKEYFSNKIIRTKKRKNYPYDLAILVDDSDKTAPSDKKAIEKFIKAGETIGFNTEIISNDDFNILAQFDALFIRETTNVNHITFKFSQRAIVEGMVVIDDPESILRCTNKVYLSELLKYNKIPTPNSIIFHKENITQIINDIKYPVILKQPDSSFSKGIIKVENKTEFIDVSTRLLNDSDLIIAQEFIQTEYDWRIGIINKTPLYACKYFMAKKHWQIVSWKKDGSNIVGKWKTFPLYNVPDIIIETALKAANLIGDGLYGVDIKYDNGKCYVIEVNDNPSIESGVEDQVLKDKLYLKIMKYFMEKILEKKYMKHS